MTTRQIGRYQIVRAIGEGGMATVYEGIDPQMNRAVAVKLMESRLTQDPAFRKRFRREVDVLRRLNHPYVAGILDYGEHEEQPFLVMPLLSGGTLADLLGGGPLPPDRIAGIVTRIGNVLDYAHRQGIIHRDIKPANILFDNQGLPYLSDFGIVKVLGEGYSTVTHTGTSLGTPGYMSPEQVRGRWRRTAAATSTPWGWSLFEMLTGRLPYVATDPFAQAFQHVHDPIPQVRDVNAKLASGWQPIIDRALAKDRASRYMTASAMSADISTLVQSTGTARVAASAKSTAPSTPEEPEGRRRFWLGAAAIAAVVTLIGGAWFGYSQVMPSRGAVANTNQVTPVAMLASVGEATVTSPPATLPRATAFPTSTLSQELVLPPSTATHTPTTTPSATASRSGPPLFRVSTETPLYEGPGSLYTTSTMLAADEEVEVIGRDLIWAWYNVRSDDGRTGWIARTVGQFVDSEGIMLIAAAATIPAPPVTATPTPPPPTAVPVVITVPIVPTLALAQPTAALPVPVVPTAIVPTPGAPPLEPSPPPPPTDPDPTTPPVLPTDPPPTPPVLPTDPPPTPPILP